MKLFLLDLFYKTFSKFDDRYFSIRSNIIYFSSLSFVHQNIKCFGHIRCINKIPKCVSIAMYATGNMKHKIISKLD